MKNYIFVVDFGKNKHTSQSLRFSQPLGGKLSISKINISAPTEASNKIVKRSSRCNIFLI